MTTRKIKAFLVKLACENYIKDSIDKEAAVRKNFVDMVLSEKKKKYLFFGPMVPKTMEDVDIEYSLLDPFSKHFFYDHHISRVKKLKNFADYGSENDYLDLDVNDVNILKNYFKEQYEKFNIGYW